MSHWSFKLLLTKHGSDPADVNEGIQAVIKTLSKVPCPTVAEVNPYDDWSVLHAIDEIAQLDPSKAQTFVDDAGIVLLQAVREALLDYYVEDARLDAGILEALAKVQETRDMVVECMPEENRGRIRL
jgi:hypothetical protein